LVQRHAGAARILVRVKIDGRPFAMVVDTGAAKTAISAGVASALDLPAAGSPIIGQTFGCRVRSQPVLLTDWRLDQRALPATAAEAHVMPTARRVDGLRVAG
jgi:hypothetical protein